MRLGRVPGPERAAHPQVLLLAVPWTRVDSCLLALAGARGWSVRRLRTSVARDEEGAVRQSGRARRSHGGAGTEHGDDRAAGEHSEGHSAVDGDRPTGTRVRAGGRCHSVATLCSWALQPWSGDRHRLCGLSPGQNSALRGTIAATASEISRSPPVSSRHTRLISGWKRRTAITHATSSRGTDP